MATVCDAMAANFHLIRTGKVCDLLPASESRTMGHSDPSRTGLTRALDTGNGGGLCSRSLPHEGWRLDCSRQLSFRSRQAADRKSDGRLFDCRASVLPRLPGMGMDPTAIRSAALPACADKRQCTNRTGPADHCRRWLGQTRVGRTESRTL